eukprot:TRINITY_DN2571_c0_g1_i1.p1 TRINITY_DN2571_c0_g1~~TRINITY_DN2571_c0_g1_i1.p1  ORF type:complete len:230 (+),score=73.67 TRINITY_DN2571_c0_g1_i1:173-862(+)
MTQEELVSKIVAQFDEKYGEKLRAVKELLSIPNLVPSLSNYSRQIDRIVQQYMAAAKHNRTRNDHKNKFMTVPMGKGRRGSKGEMHEGADKNGQRKTEVHKKEAKKSSRLGVKTASQKNIKQVKDNKRQNVVKKEVKNGTKEQEKNIVSENKKVEAENAKQSKVEESKVCNETKDCQANGEMLESNIRSELKTNEEKAVSKKENSEDNARDRAAEEFEVANKEAQERTS